MSKDKITNSVHKLLSLPLSNKTRDKGKRFRMVASPHCCLNDPNLLFIISHAFHLAQNYIIHVPSK